MATRISNRDRVRILLVENSVQDARATRDLLLADDRVQSVVQARFLRTALEKLANGGFDIVLLDSDLPDSSGVDSVRSILARDPGIPIVVQIAHGRDELAVAALEEGAHDYIVKGQHDGEELLRSVRFAEIRTRRIRAVEEYSTKLSESRGELAAIFDGAPIPMIVIDSRSRVHKANRGAAEFTQRAEREMEGLRPGEALHCLNSLNDPNGCGSGDSCEDCAVRTGILDTLAMGEAHRTEATLQFAVENRRFCRTVHLTTSPVEGKTGRMVLVCLEDITDRKAAAEALQESQRRYELATESGNVGVWDWDFVTAEMSVDPSVKAMLGYQDHETADRVDDWRRHVHPDEVEAIMASVEEHVAGKTPQFEFEHRIFDRDGSVRWVLSRGTAVRDDQGTTQRLVGTFTDITDRKRAEDSLRRSEERYRQLFERNMAGVFRTTLGGRALQCNEAMARILGFESAEEVLGLHVREFYPMLDGREAFANALLASGRLTNHEIELRRRDGTPAWCLLNAALVPDESGDRDVIEGTLVDLTARKQAEEQLRHAQKMEAVGRLAGGVAHDFNNLLQAFAGMTHALRRFSGDPEAMKERVAELNDLVKRGSHLSRQLLLFSRKDAYQPEALDLNAVSKTTEKLIRHLLRENIQVSMSLADEPLPVEADQGQLEQVIINLAVNAQDAMPGGGRLAVRTSRTGDGFASLEVKDTGHGIPEGIRATIFEPFFTTKEAEQGTGLGLSVVHGIVTRFGGTISVDSEIERGSTFRIDLPLRLEGKTVAKGGAQTALDSLPQGKGERILLVEDEGDVRKAICEMLRLLGYRVESAGSVAAATEDWMDSEFELLVTDVVLPDGSGLELVDRMRSNRPELAVITMSGYPTETPGVEEIESGSLRFMRKPFGIEQMAWEVRAALDPIQEGALRHES